MFCSANNPSSNRLGAGIRESDIRAAVDKSGYPLQTVIADMLRKSLGVQEEWSYVDRNSKQLRTVDILAGKHLYDIEGSQPRVRPHLNLIIECKQSTLPYIFFLSESKPWLPEFPVLAGLGKNTVEITSDDTASSWTLPMLEVLGMCSHDFMRTPHCCTTFSKCVRKGSELELSGSEAYNGLVLPLIDSLEHFQFVENPPSTAWYFDSHVVVGVGLLDAPMIGVRVTSQDGEFTLLPWVRVLRHEYSEDTYRMDKSKMFVIDVVHKDFFQKYIDEHLMPYAECFAKAVLDHKDVVATGKAFIAGMERDWVHDIPSRLQPRTYKAGISRAKATVKNIVGLFAQRKRDGDGG